MNKYGIIGLGWLGKELAIQLQAIGCDVWGTSTHIEKVESLTHLGIQAHLFELQEENYKGNLFNQLKETTHLLVNIPPKLRRNKDTDFVSKLLQLISLITQFQIQHLIYVSTTSVFEDQVGIPEYTELSLPNSTSIVGKQLIEAENKILKLSSKTRTIQVLRLGGLVGGERHPAKFLSGQTEVKSPQAPVNLISRVDAINLILALFEHKKSGIFHGVYPNYPTRRVFYSRAFNKMNLKEASFKDDDQNKGKKISSLKTSSELNFSFIKQP